jgi:hypothetical protein
VSFYAVDCSLEPSNIIHRYQAVPAILLEPQLVGFIFWIVAIIWLAVVSVVDEGITARKGRSSLSVDKRRQEKEHPTMSLSQTPSMGVSRVMSSPLFADNSQISSTSAPTFPPIVARKAGTTSSLDLTTTYSGTVDETLLEAELPNITMDVDVHEMILPRSKEMTSFFQDIVDNLIKTSHYDLIPASQFRSSSLDISFVEKTDPLSIRMFLNGTASFVMVDSASTVISTSHDDAAFRDAVQQILVSYLSFWGTREIETELNSLGLYQANVTTISIDGGEIVIDNHDTWFHGSMIEGPSDEIMSFTTMNLDRKCWMWITALTGLGVSQLF